MVVETLVLTVSAANRGGEGYTSMDTKKQLWATSIDPITHKANVPPGKLVKTFRQLVYFSSSVLTINLSR